jgi:hypothetical protein
VASKAVKEVNITGVLGCVHHPEFQKPEHDLSETGIFRPYVKEGRKVPTLLRPLERANLNH